ncbi:BgtTE-56112 [Blumeria graminis f. sp. tritici]|uniref:BgtTE-56112 n=1 Tax=Blumeria graminis f. sp. tritici TaxID=62690 RepID=A0A9X9MN13_BLUGR|nr:BgtTE-56112 [Blumeria graminis f. sp. tritici]
MSSGRIESLFSSSLLILNLHGYVVTVSKPISACSQRRLAQTVLGPDHISQEYSRRILDVFTWHNFLVEHSRLEQR